MSLKPDYGLYLIRFGVSVVPNFYSVPIDDLSLGESGLITSMVNMDVGGSTTPRHSSSTSASSGA